MKQTFYTLWLIIILLVIGLFSCNSHPPIDFTHPSSITKIDQEGGKGYFINKTECNCLCLFHTTINSSRANRQDGWFVDSCAKYKVGDSIELIKK